MHAQEVSRIVHAADASDLDAGTLEAGAFQSGAALATVVGVLIEVPVMLLVVGVVNRSQRWYEKRLVEV